MQEDDEELVAASANGPTGRPRIYKTEGLHERLEEFQWTDGAPWTETLIVTSELPTEVPNVHDDLNRELAFYNQALAAAKAGMLQLIDDRCPFRCVLSVALGTLCLLARSSSQRKVAGSTGLLCSYSVGAPLRFAALWFMSIWA
jgi:hypothetical protein